MKFDPEKQAAALLASPSAQGRSDFADRAAACHLLLSHRPAGADFLSLWPGRLDDFAQTLTPAQNRRLALAILDAAAAPAG